MQTIAFRSICLIFVTIFCSTTNTMIDEMLNNFEQTNPQLIQGIVRFQK